MRAEKLEQKKKDEELKKGDEGRFDINKFEGYLVIKINTHLVK